MDPLGAGSALIRAACEGFPVLGFSRVIGQGSKRVSRYGLMAAVLVCGNAVAAGAAPHNPTADIAVGPQYDSTHVYVAPSDLDAFVASFVATFGGHARKPIVSTVTPTASSTQFQYIMSLVGTLSTFAYSTPIPYPFGLERTGYLVTDMTQALAAARSAGASIIVAPFKDPIGMDAVIEWPGGVKMQLYWHFVAPSYGTRQARSIFSARHDRIEIRQNAHHGNGRATALPLRI